MIIYLIYLIETGHSIVLIYDLENHLVISPDGYVFFQISIVGEHTNISLVVVPLCGGIGV